VTWISIYNHAERQKNKHFKSAEDLAGYNVLRDYNAKTYEAKDTKHGKED
jgi:hypothetical protein